MDSLSGSVGCLEWPPCSQPSGAGIVPAVLRHILLTAVGRLSLSPLGVQIGEWGESAGTVYEAVPTWDRAGGDL